MNQLLERKGIYFASLLIAMIAISFLARAKDEAENPHWLTSQETQALEVQEPPPPVAGSPEDQADFKADLAAQASRTPTQIAEAQGDNSYSVALFTNVIGPQITRESDPLTFRLFDRLNKEVSEIVTQSKENWKRPRPFLAHAEIHPLFKAGGFSYPSGHSTHSYAFASILGVLFPDKTAAFFDRAHLIAQSRVDAGVHYPSDIREGEVLGKAIAQQLLTKPDFQTELNAAKAELGKK